MLGQRGDSVCSAEGVPVEGDESSAFPLFVYFHWDSHPDSPADDLVNRTQLLCCSLFVILITLLTES